MTAVYPDIIDAHSASRMPWDMLSAVIPILIEFRECLGVGQGLARLDVVRCYCEEEAHVMLLRDVLRQRGHPPGWRLCERMRASVRCRGCIRTTGGTPPQNIRRKVLESSLWKWQPAVVMSTIAREELEFESEPYTGP